MVLVSPTEPLVLRAVGTQSRLPEKWGADLLLPAAGRLLGVQRKTVDDLLASLEDGRLQLELAQLRKLELRSLLLEGYPEWTADGWLLSRRRYTRNQFWGIIFSVSFVFGVPVLWTGSLDESVGLVRSLARWLTKGAHRSLMRRPTARSASEWGTATDRDFARHLLQGFPGVGSVLAEAIFDHFDRIPLAWDVSRKELAEVPGIGPKRADALWRSLEIGSAGARTKGKRSRGPAAAGQGVAETAEAG